MHLLFERDDFGERLGHRPTIWHSLKAGLRGWWASQHDRAARRRSLARLADMEEWQLDDIGITRAEVNQVLERNGIERDPALPIQPH